MQPGQHGGVLPPLVSQFPIDLRRQLGERDEREGLVREAIREEEVRHVRICCRFAEERQGEEAVWRLGLCGMSTDEFSCEGPKGKSLLTSHRTTVKPQIRLLFRPPQRDAVLQIRAKRRELDSVPGAIGDKGGAAGIEQNLARARANLNNGARVKL